MPKSAKTGTEKKATKAAYHSAKAREKIALPGYKKGIKELEGILRGKHAPTTSLDELMERFQRAGQGAADIFAPIKEQALHEFQTNTLPQVAQQFGASDVGGSSALRQALAASRENLQRSLAADFAGLQTNLASSFLNQSEGNKISALNARLSSASGLTGQGVNPVLANIAGQPSYLSHQGTTSLGKRIGAAALPIAGAALGSFIPGAGTIAGATLGASLGGTTGQALFS